MSEAPDELFSLVDGTILAHVVNDHGRSAELFGRICDLGDQALFAACMGWAETIVQFMKLRESDTIAYPEIEHVEGSELSLSDPDCRHALWIGRFISAVANRDTQTALALFHADPSGDELARHAVALVDLAAQLVRDRADDSPLDGAQ